MEDLHERLPLSERTSVKLDSVAEYLETADVREIVARMLRNLKAIFLKAKDWSHALTVIEWLVQVVPDTPQELRGQGLVYQELECFRAALHDFEAYLRQEPEATDASKIRTRVLDMRGRGATELMSTPPAAGWRSPTCCSAWRACYGRNLVVGRAMRAEIPPVAMSFWRWTIAFLLILPFTYRDVWSKRADIARAWPVLTLLGLVGIGLFNTMCYIALTMTTATNATLFNSVVPVFIPPIAWVLLRERTTARQMIGILSSLLGVLVIVAKGDMQALQALDFNRGDVWLLIAMVLWALYTVLLRFRPGGMGMLTFLATILVFGWPMLAVW
ncbi:MAG: tetratricopeptide repeat protein [Betaproteobacteria bacterium]|nr:tetratricopeptide repeat protein [Betaproteobacteria bacterium]